MHPARRFIVAVAALTLAASMASCGDDDNGSAAADAPSTAAAAAVRTACPGMSITTKPTKIVSMSPSATEILFAIGAGTQVVAADKNSNYPKDAPTTDLDAYQPNTEAIAAKSPDLVVVSNDTNDLVKGLCALKIPVLLQAAPADLDGEYQEIAELGRVTRHVAGATDVVARIKRGIAKVVADVGSDGKARSYYYELDQTYYSVTSKTFIGQLVGMLGVTNIADAAGGKANDYPQLSAEYIVRQDPDLILLADTKCCQQSSATVAARPGWSKLHAVSGGGVVELDDDVASRWGPRVVDLLEDVAAAVEKVAGKG